MKPIHGYLIGLTHGAVIGMLIAAFMYAHVMGI